MGTIRRRFVCAALFLLLVLSMTISPDVLAQEAEPDQETENLEKLCLVWGYAKYTHPAYLSGQRDWDADLLKLVEPIMEANTGEEANDLLRSYIESLGLFDYGTDFIDAAWCGLEENQKVFLSRDDWRSDAEYLGAELSQVLSQISEIPTVYHGNAPVYASPSSPDGITVRFDNEQVYENMDYADEGYRLLGLFRLWNAIEYFYPYLDALDSDWHELLPSTIRRMLDGSDRQSYQLTLYSLTARLQDAHAAWADVMPLLEEIGAYCVPVSWMYIDGKVAVCKAYEACGLQPGDVILEMNGSDMQEIISRRKEYISVTDGTKLINAMGYYLLRSPEQKIELTILRGEDEISLTVQGSERFYAARVLPDRFHHILRGNIGLVQPACLASEKDIRQIMDEFSDTAGLIIDLRQPSAVTMHEAFGEYVVGDRQAFALWRYPSWTVPGGYSQYDVSYIGGSGLKYDQPVVLLIDERTQSHGEYAAMALSMGENVTLMGTNTVGSDGNVTLLVMPDGNFVQFSGWGVLAAEGEQTQRIGIAPDIYVSYTAQGIAEGRDELLEAAVQYLTKQHSIE